MNTNYDIGFFSHILPQLISMSVMLFGFICFFRKFNGKASYSNLGTALIALLFGKIALFLFHDNQLAVKLITASSLTFYFVFMLNELSNNAKLSSKIVVMLNTILLVILSVNYDSVVSSRFESLSFIAADVLLFLVGLKTSFSGKKLMLTSFLMFIGIHAMIVHCSLESYWCSIVYAWAELPAQIVFLVGLGKRVKDLIKK